MIAYTIYCMNSTEKKKPSIYEWWPLITDPPKEQPDVYTEEEKEQLVKDSLERLNMLQYATIANI